jgi:uncharacterized protein (TIGR00290 family)
MVQSESASKPKVIVSWSSGKDSCYSLMEILSNNSYQIAGLLTTVTRAYNRVSMHGVRESLLERQAEELHLPLMKAEIPSPCSNEQYEKIMGGVMDRFKTMGISHMVFGDIFLEDIRKYREEKLAPTGITPIFPIWGRDPRKLAVEIIRAGIKARIVCLDPRKLGREFAGRVYNEELLSDLPPNVDLCGENGEFHTFVYGSPAFKNKEIHIRTGETVERDGFVFTDVEEI